MSPEDKPHEDLDRQNTGTRGYEGTARTTQKHNILAFPSWTPEDRLQKSSSIANIHRFYRLEEEATEK